ncbi:hypothetical protein E5676_scaffold189G00100 [Cucumis melo var. makuwa]|uniref:Uncharacterized protein n=2 Tax=Cucumis melo TaxID=3656 RepID=A0A5A7THG7_CUCMM|nr:hypothetical protein E6C27_scaffold529G00420 [Cucumis melo var. makuwa]TYK15347.1 hypothetical protein E5676_scaffold189G00100 [Cucumis melo var. makuwa]
MDNSEDDSGKKTNIHSDDSSCKRSSTTGHNMKAPHRKTFENGETIIIRRRLFHDDWSCIMFTLKKQTEIEFSYEPFHANKAILTPFEDNANLLCSNKSINGWTTVGNSQVKFERWDTKKHACQTLIPSYGGWVRFRGVPLHLWNYESFVNIGKACGGFLAVAKETMEKESLVEAKIKSPPPNERWFIERNVNFHGSFKIEVADDFDSLNPNAEEFTFAEIDVILLENSKNQADNKQSKLDKNSNSNPTHAKKNSSSNSEVERKSGSECEDQQHSLANKDLNLTVDLGHLPPLRDLDATEDVLAQVENAREPVQSKSIENSALGQETELQQEKMDEDQEALQIISDEERHNKFYLKEKALQEISVTIA